VKTALKIVGTLVAVFIALVIITGSSLVGEVVTLHTQDAEGAWQTTPLWVVDAQDGTYLRAGQPGSGWLARSRANPEVKLERDGQTQPVQLVETPEAVVAVNLMMSEKYGWANAFVSLMAGDRSKAIPLKVEVAP
jgi:hypothetical protein